ncbi:transposase family protein [Kineococcus sp. SYSU DK018]|uniref:transposase family protein n=1 Tax=Kineococcus sp. SYSU DK018 TaxID=3383139 RepID=UPI003D7E0581
MPDPVTYTAVLPTSRATVQHIAALLMRHRAVVGTRTDRRALSCFAHAVLICRFLLDAVRVAHLARDNAIGVSTAYRYVHEALDVLAAQAPGLRPALLAAHAAGHTHVNLDGTLVVTHRVGVQGPTVRRGRSHGQRRVDLWWSGKHRCHGGNIQVVTAPDGWPIWVSPVRPGREHDVTCARTHLDLLPALVEFSDAGHTVLADLGYEGERARLTCPHKVTTNRDLDVDQRSFNRVHAHLRARAEQGNAWLKNYRALQKVTLCPWRVGVIAAAILVVLHLEHDRTT